MGKRNIVFSLTAVVAYFLLSLAKCGNSLDLERANEQSCFKIENSTTMDSDWFSSVKLWYYPLMNRYDLYNSVYNLLKENVIQLSENKMYYDGCITWKITESTFEAKGFDGQTATYDIKTLGKGFQSYEIKDEQGYGGTCYNTLTDNSTFIFNACCSPSDNQMTWFVGSTTKKLPKETTKLIHDHAESLGFKREFFTELRYDSCKFN